MLQSNFKDPELKGIYVRRCKCGSRPEYDRIDPCIPTYGCWIECRCGLVGKSGNSKQEAIDLWNSGEFEHERRYDTRPNI